MAQNPIIAPASQTITTPGYSPNLVKIAKIVSLVLHPFLISPLGIVIILWLDTGNLLSALAWAGLCAAFVVAPASIYLAQKLKKKAYTDADVSVKEHRYGFYLFGGICMTLCFATLIWLDAPGVLTAGFLTALVALVAAIVVNRFWTKISIHTGAIVGVATATAYYSLPLAGLLFSFALLISWARLVTGRHTIIEAVAAWAVSVVCVIVVFGPLH